MISDLITDEELLYLGAELNERGEGFIEMFDALPTSHATVEDFLTELARVSNRPIVRNILLADIKRPERHRTFLRWLDACHAEGLPVYGMAFTVRSPSFLTFEDWSLWDNSPTWNLVMNGTFEERAARMTDPEIRARLVLEYEKGMINGQGTSGYPENLVVHGTGGVARFEELLGRRVGDLAAQWGVNVVDVLLDLSIESRFQVEFKGESIAADPELIGEILRSPYAVPGISDGGAHCHFIVQGAYPTDLLEWAVREHGLITYEQAHYALSRLPAHMAGFTDRGVLREGGPADIVVYDPKTIARAPSWDRAERTFDWPADGWRWTQRAYGLHFTIVNGQITFEGTECTGATPGRLLAFGRG